MALPILTAEDDTRVNYHSSISQHSNKLHILKGGEAVPISFDVLDYIDCDRLVSHRAILADGDDIGFNFPTGSCTYVSDEYIYMDGDRKELRQMPHWFGEGTYEAFIKEYDFINADNGSLGSRNKITTTVGLNYALAEETLKGE